MLKSKNTLDTLLNSHQKRLAVYISSRLNNQQDANDILQETLISALDAFPSFKGKSTFFTWLCGIANHEVADYYRKKKIKTLLFSLFPFLEDLAEQALGPEQQLLKQELEQETKKKVHCALDKLSEGYSEILRLRYYQRLSVGEIAKQLHANYKTIESRLSRARKAFEEIYRSGFSQGNLPIRR